MDIRPIGNAASPPSTALDKNASPVSATYVAARPVAEPVKTTTAAVQQPGAIPDLTQLSEAVERLNKMVQNMSPDLEFSVDEDSERTIVKVVDQKTKEIIRQIPSKETIEIAQALGRIQGLLIRQKA